MYVKPPPAAALARLLSLVASLLLLLGAPVPGSADDADGFFASPSVHWKSGDHRVDLGAAVRVRGEAWNAFADDTDWYTGVRTRVRAQYGFRERLFLVGEFQDVHLLGMNENGTGALAVYRRANASGDDAGGDDLRLLYVEGRLPDRGFLRIGRQDVKLGQEVLYPEPAWRYLKTARLGERLVGTVGWTHVERAYDGGAGALELAGYELYGFAARPTTGVFDAEHAYEDFTDIEVGGATLTAKRGTLVESSEQGVFGLGYHDHRPTHDGGLPRGVAIGTFGAYWLGVYAIGPGDLDLLVWGAGQFGDYDGLDHAAGAGIFEIGYQLRDVFAKPWLRLGVNAASGDGDPTDGDHDTFFNVLPTNHQYYGFADQLAFQNLLNPFVQLRLAPHPMLALNLFVHGFELISSQDARYSGTGAYDESSFGFTANPSAGEHHVGIEVDSVATVTLHRTTTLELGYAWLAGGAMFRSQPSRDVHFFYASLEIRY